ncbi:MAG TPA: beta-galactosidase GalB [Verrucomicrobiae bacterium]|nr:beta-galactosidase GalB [Verrucomicrobiae bacterium]
MTRLRLTILAALIPFWLLAPHTTSATPSPRERIPFDDNWRFIRDDPAGIVDELNYTNVEKWVNVTGADLTTSSPTIKPEGNPGSDVSYVQPSFDDSMWRQLDLPHDWAIEGPFRQEYDGSTGKLRYWGPVWYRKHFVIPPEDAGKKLFLDLDGAMSYSEVWLNGRFVGGWPYGYSSFELDLTPFIKPGADNVIAIRLDSPPESSRWYPGAGIYRNVWLVETAPVHLSHWGTFVTTPEVDSSLATVRIKTRVDNETGDDAGVTVKNEIFELKPNGDKGRRVNSLTTNSLQISPHRTVSNEVQVVIRNPRLWSVAEPQRYVVVSSLVRDGRLVDRVETPFGIRTIQFTINNGFLLNGQRLRINGVCLHHDLGALGAAVNTRALERHLELLREMGCNAIRTSHNPPAPELLDLCDRMGFIVMDEAFDCWERQKRPGDYHLVFDNWHEKDLRALIHRDRNHPCVVLWSIGNEIYEQYQHDGWKLAAQLAALVHEEDSTRPVTAALHTIAASTNGFQRVVDVFGYNYKPFGYAEFRTNNPGLPLFGSETSSCISSRGEYFFPVTDDKKQGCADFQVTSYDVSAPPWAMPPDAEFKGQDENPFVAGEFVWTGFDYLGEPTPYDRASTNQLVFTQPGAQEQMDDELRASGKIEVPSRSSYFGILDLCGFKKDRFYLYQARWRPDLPMAHILPHWNWPERVGQITPVQVYTSGDEAELFLNGKSLGRKKMEPHEYRLRWDQVVYEPGTLRAVAYKNGRRWAVDTVRTAGPPAKLTLSADRAKFRADGKDLAFLTVTVEDKDGLMAPRAKNLIRFSVEGPGEIVATDNGDATSHVSFQSKEREAFNGLCLVIVRAKAGTPGRITLHAESNGLRESAIALHSVNR